MKSQLKNKDGMALVTVLVLIFVLSLMGTAMYAYSFQSLNVIKWGSDKKKAEYIARAGIEAAAFAYQDTEYNSGNNDEAGTYALKFTEAAKREYFIGKENNKIIIQYKDDTGTPKKYDESVIDERTLIKTNWIYMCNYNASLDAASLSGSKVVYVDGGSGEEGVAPDRNYVGCFRVTVTNQPQLAHVNSGCTAGNKCENESHWRVENYKKFISVGWVNGKRATRSASVITTNYARDWIADDGTLQLDKKNSTDSRINYAGDIKVTYPTWLGIVQQSSVISLYAGTAVGNLVVTAPNTNNPIRFEQSGSHANAMVGMNNLFINGDIDVTPSNPGFGKAPNINMLYLSGNNIVINGDITMYAYYFSNNWLTNIASSITGKIRLGSVIINVPSSVESSVDDPLPKTQGGLGQCGKIFFNGDVYVVIGRRNTADKKYKIFSAGDVCYFDAQFKNNNSSETSTGIDLLKYFLDTSIEQGKYTKSVRTQFQKIRDYYYANTYTNNYTLRYTATTTPSMRLVEPGKKVDSITDTLPPSTSDASYIVWE